MLCVNSNYYLFRKMWFWMRNWFQRLNTLIFNKLQFSGLAGWLAIPLGTAWIYSHVIIYLDNILMILHACTESVQLGIMAVSWLLSHMWNRTYAFHLMCCQRCFEIQNMVGWNNLIQDGLSWSHLQFASLRNEQY